MFTTIRQTYDVLINGLKIIVFGYEDWIKYANKHGIHYVDPLLYYILNNFARNIINNYAAVNCSTVN